MDMWKNIKTFCTLAGITLTGLAVSSIFVGIYLYEPMKNKAEEEEKEEELHYRMKYFQELDDMEERKMTKKELKDLGNKTIHESTPEGDVIMMYSSDTETFWYFADTKSIPYWVLDTVARLYTIENNCKCVCVNYQEEFYKGKEKTLTEKEKDEHKGEDIDEEKKEEEKSVFAKFKSYNKGRGNETKEKKLKKYRIMTEVSNRFTYKGRLSECEDTNEDKDEEAPARKAPLGIDFATFKNRFSNAASGDKIKTS
jgi:hypothetical protein